MDMNVFAKRLKEARQARNISARELAEQLGINKSTIHRYETGEPKGIKPPLVQAIAEYLKVNPDYLIGASDNKHTAQEAEAILTNITDDEKMLLELFRQVPIGDQQLALDVLRAVLKRGQ